MIRGYTVTIAISLATLLHFGTAAAQGNISAAYYGIQSPGWQCSESLKAFDGSDTINISFLFNTFGNSFNCLNNFTKDPRTKHIEIHILNEVCLRNGRCGPYEFLAGQTLQGYERAWATNDAGIRRKLDDYARPLVSYVAQLPDRVRCTVSGGLESNLSTEAGKNLTREVKRLFPRCDVVWNPMSGRPIPGTIFESHGSRPRLEAPCIANLDGEDINFPDRHSELANKINASEVPGYLDRYRHCEAANLWISEFNGNCPGSGFVDPRKRSCFASKRIFDLVRPLIRKGAVSAGSVPPWDDKAKLSEKGCRTFEKAEDGIKRDFVWKESDTKKNSAGELVALVLFPRKFKQRFKSVDVLSGGKLIEQFDFVYNYTEDGSNRQVWKSDRAPSDYPYNVVLKADGVCFRLRNPRARID